MKKNIFSGEIKFSRWTFLSTIFYLIIYFSISSCRTTRHFEDVPYAEGEECIQGLRNPSDRTFSTPYADAVEEDKLEDSYSTSSLRVAHALGIVPYLLVLDSVNNLEEQTEDERMLQLEVQNKINNRVQLASLEISSVVAALQCEQNRAYQVADFLRQQERRRERNRNVLSITISAAAALIDVSFLILPGALLEGLLSIGASAAIVAVSLSTLHHNATATFIHPDNLLEEIWRGPEESTLIPSSIWYYLTNPYFSLHDERSIREQLVRRWVQLQEVEEDEDEEPDDTETRLVFTEGGVYTADQLRKRAVMLEHAAAEVNLMQRNLQGLVREIIEVKH